MFFTKSVNKLKFLATTGIPISTRDGIQQVYLTVGACIGDNKAFNQLLGFTTGFTANYPCRFCHVKSSEMCIILKESQCKLRDEISYQSDLLLDDLKKQVSQNNQLYLI